MSSNTYAQYDPYVGEVYGNPLDFYDNVTYNLRLYMIRKDIANSLNASSSFNKALNGPLAAPNDTVIIAQTGVTNIQIDNLEIDALVFPDTGSREQTIRFDVIEPGMAGFLDQIQMAKAYLGYNGKDADHVMFLDIRFQGYEADTMSDSGDVIENGKPTVVAGPYVYKINMQQFNVSLDERGATYNCQGIIETEYGYDDRKFRLPELITTKGKTIREHVEDLQSALNSWQTSTTGDQVPDQYEFDLSNLIGADEGGTVGFGLINDDSLVLSSDPKVDKRNRPLNELYDIEDSTETTQAVESSGSDTGTAPEAVYDVNIIKFQPGITLEQVFYILLSMCPEFEAKVSRKEDFSDVASKVKKEQAYVNWVKVIAEVEPLEFDKVRNETAKKYVYSPVIYKTTNPKVALDPEEQRPSEEEKQSRLAQLKADNMLLKAYNYIFTGLNDQILSLDISYNGLNPQMLPPKYGAVGSFRTSPYVYGSGATNAVPAETDVTHEAMISEIVNKAKEFKEVGSILDLLKGLASDLIGGVSGQLSELLGSGETPDSIREKIENQTGLTELSQQIVAQADTLNLNPIEQNSQVVPTEDPEVSQDPETDAPYSPVTSGYIYAADFIDADTDPVYAERLGEIGYVGFEQTEPLSDVPLKASSSEDKANPVEDATGEIASPKNKLFGFLTYQNTDHFTPFLQEIDITLRGDPWYLGMPGIGKSDDTIANYNVDDNLFWLNIAAPQKFDPDWRDEDSDLNSGYWNMSRNSKTFSGVYRMIKVTNKFSSGVYTIDLNGQRIWSIDKPGSASTTTEEDSSFGVLQTDQNQPDNTDNTLENITDSIIDDTLNDLFNPPSTETPYAVPPLAASMPGWLK